MHRVRSFLASGRFPPQVQMSQMRSNSAIYTSARLFATKKFTSDHEWVQLNETGDVATVGITDYAQQALGDVVFVEVPPVGKKVSIKDSIGAVESVKAASDVYAPVSGEIVDSNSQLESEPSLINSGPELDGWIAKIKLANKSEVDSLMDSKAYQDFCKSK